MMAQLTEDRTALVLALGLGGALAVAAALLPPLQLGLVLLAFALALLAVFARHAFLYLILPAIALSPDIPLAGIPVRIEDLLMVPLVAGWLARLCVSPDRQRTSLDRVLIAYLVIGVLATLWGGYLGTAHFFNVTKDYSAPLHLLKRLEFVLLFFIVSDTLKTPRQVRGLTYMLMISMLGLSVYALMQYLGNQKIAEGPVGAPGHEPGVASMINVALALSLLPAATRPAKVLLWAVMLFSLAVVPLTLGRNYVSTTAIVILYMGLFYQRWLLLVLPIAWLIGLLHFYPPAVAQQMLTLQHVFAPDITGEQSGGAALLSRTVPPRYFGTIVLGHSPLIGFGMGSLALGSFDSEPVTQLYYTGIAGFAIFLILGARVLRATVETMRVARDPLHVGLARGFHLIWIAYAAHSVFSPSISASRVGAVFFLTAALATVLHRAFTQTQTQEQPATAPVQVHSTAYAR